MSKICIIVPVYNRKTMLNRCVNSIINQTFSDWSLLLVDDGSTDGSELMCDDFASSDVRIHVLHKQNGGVSSARNAGLDWAFAHDSSSWLAFLDSDDWVNPTYLQKLLAMAESYHVQISCCNYSETTNSTLSVQVDTDAQNVEPLLTECFWYQYPSPSVVPWGKLYAKELFLNIRYPLGKVCDDTFTTHKILFQCDRVAWTSQKLYYYHISRDGISRERNALLLTQWSEAYEEQVAFFYNRKLLRVCNEAVRRMLTHKQQAIIYASSKHDVKTVRNLKKDMQRQLAWVQKELGIRLYGNESIFQPVMPVRASISRTFRHAKRNIRKLFIH